MCLAVAGLFLVTLANPVSAKPCDEGREPEYIPPVGVDGYVRDNSGNPIYYASVSGGGEYTHIDQNGYYFLQIEHMGQFLITAIKPGYWEQRLNASITAWIPLAHANFQLVSDQVSFATLLALYATVNLAHSNPYLEWQTGHQSTNEVKAFVAGSGWDFTVSSGTIAGGSVWGKTSWIRQRAVIVHGIYYNTPGDFNNAYVTSQSYFVNHDDWTDYKAHTQVVGETELVFDGAYQWRTKTDSGSMTLAGGLSVSIVTTILGVGCSYTFECILSDTESVSKSITLGVQNNDSVDHWYEWYLEGGNVFHLWEKTGP